MTKEAEYWFKPRSYGYGAAPTNWKGWAIGLAYVAAVWGMGLAFALTLGEPLDWKNMALWFGGIAVITVPFIWLCRVKTDGEWRWTWGEK